MRRTTRMDYRCYHVDPPKHERKMWTARALLRGMPDFEAWSEGDLRQQIDDAYERRNK